jgi:hypothetical protein
MYSTCKELNFGKFSYLRKYYFFRKMLTFGQKWAEIYLAKWLERLTADAKVALVLGSIPTKQPLTQRKQ